MSAHESIEANRQMWNETADVHAQAYVQTLLEQIKAPDFTTFDEVEQRIFAGIGLSGKAVIQLSCNNGRELISVKKAGAGRCVGVDISDKFIEQGRQLAVAANVDVEFLRANVYDIPREYDGQFDLVYVTVGALGWLPDLDAYFGLVARLLNRDGQLFIYEMHPILNMFDKDSGLAIKNSYFRSEPFVEGSGPDYLDPSQMVNATSYWFPYKLSDVIGGCLKHGLSLTHFEEYAHDLSTVFVAFEQFENKLPLSFSLVARKII